MSDLPRVSGREAVAALEKAGFRVKRQHGSHIVLRRDEPSLSLLFLIIGSLIEGH